MDYYITSDGELYHYGVKGMRWGVRKARKAEKAALGRAAKATTDKERESALSDAKKHQSEISRITKAHINAKAQKQHLKLREDGSITEFTKAERVARGKKISKGAVAGLGITAAAVVTVPAVMTGHRIIQSLLEFSRW